MNSFARMNWESPASVGELAGGEVRKVDWGTVLTFACGCASWMTYPASTPDQAQGALDRMVSEGSDLWADATATVYRRVDGRMVNADTGQPLPSYRTCTHREGW